MKREDIQIKVASFREALMCFVTECDDTLSLNTVGLFSELKSSGKISHQNEPIYWDGNHSHSWKKIELFRVEHPTLFYIVRVTDNIWEHQGFQGEKVQNFVFIP